MKILCIRFENLNSLKGKHEIDFTKTPLSDSGLFAITGPTGSGKSTILDAITLALFGEVPRMGTISKGEIEKKNAIITHGTKQAMAEVEYQSKGGSFRSRWSIARNRNNNLNEHQLEVAELENSTVLFSNLQQVKKFNIEQIGLSYEQFNKAILLSQGEFARFLKEKKAEQILLLEHLSGTGEYRIIGKALFEKHKELKNEIDRLVASLEGQALLTDEEKEKINEQIRELTEKEKSQEPLLTELEQQIRTIESLLKEKENLEKKKNEQSELRKEEEKFGEEDDRLLLHEKVMVFRDKILSYRKDENEIRDIKNALENYKKESENELQLRDQILKEISILFPVDGADTEKIIADIDQRLVQLQKIKQQKGELDGRLSGIKNSKRAFFVSLSEDTQNESRKIADPLSVLNSLEHKLKEEYKALSTEKLNTRSDFYREGSAELIRLGQMEKQQEERAKRISALLSEKEMCGHEIEKLKAENTDLSRSCEIQQESVLNLSRQKEIEESKAGLDAFRHLLKEGEACPLCGSTEHHISNSVQSLDKYKILLEEESKKLELLKKRKDTLTLDLKAAENRLSVFEKEIADLINLNASEAGTIKKELSELDAKYNLNQSSIAEKIHELKNKETELRKAVEQKSDIKALREIIELLKEEKNITDEQDALIKQESLLNPDQVFESRHNEWKKHLHNIEQNTQRIKKERDQKEKALKEKTEHFQQQETLLLEELDRENISGILACEKMLLSPEMEKNIRNKKEEIRTKKTALNQSLKELSERILELEKKRTSNENPDFLREKHILLQSEFRSCREKNIQLQERLRIDKENTERKSGMLNELEIKRKNFRKWEILNNLIGDREGTKFSKIVQEITLNRLVLYANNRLRGLTDRYRIYKPHDKDMNLQVEDAYLGHSLRDVATLSGGETFLLSLALSLALSDLAAKNVKLESLFIDEGFGTLDPETLDTALSTLEKLQSEDQKIIGVISHVESLKERISTRIRLEKKSNGISTLYVEG